MTIRQVSVELVPAAGRALARLRERTGLNAADVVNRALQVYDLVEERTRAGYAWQFLDEYGNGERVTFE